MPTYLAPFLQVLIAISINDYRCNRHYDYRRTNVEPNNETAKVTIVQRSLLINILAMGA